MLNLAVSTLFGKFKNGLRTMLNQTLIFTIYNRLMGVPVFKIESEPVMLKIMSASMSKILYSVDNTDEIYQIHGVSKHVIMCAPVIITVLCAIFLAMPSTRNATLWMLAENHPVELLTFAIALFAGILGLMLAFRLKAREENMWVYGFYAVFSAALIFIALEEIAWGQKFLGFDTPELWRKINRQAETTLHNVGFIQGRTEFLRLIFGLGGGIGVWLSSFPYFRKIGSPKLLLPWFAIIILHSLLDAYNDYFPIEAQFDNDVNQLSELVELLIVTSGLFFIKLNSRMLLTALKPQ